MEKHGLTTVHLIVQATGDARFEQEGRSAGSPALKGVGLPMRLYRFVSLA